MSAPGVSITASNPSIVLGRISSVMRGAERDIKDALDKTAVLVMELAKSEHPKVRDSIQGEAAMPLRKLTGPLAGEFAFKPRFLTRTGNLRNSIKMSRARREAFSGEISASVFAAIEYADDVELIYPFMIPALISSQGVGRALVEAAMLRRF